MSLSVCYGCSFLLIQACSDFQVGQKLADSFEQPLVPQEKLTSKQMPKTEEVNSNVVLPKRVQENNKVASKTSNKELGRLANQNPLLPKKNIVNKKRSSRQPFYKPQPYRIIIRLAGANPSAPAETVTSALRDAGVVFEVEKIERYEKGSSPPKTLKR